MMLADAESLARVYREFDTDELLWMRCDLARERYRHMSMLEEERDRRMVAAEIVLRERGVEPPNAKSAHELPARRGVPEELTEAEREQVRAALTGAETTCAC